MTDIAQLFARDPLRHSDDDIRAIVQHFRETRVNFNLTGKAAPKEAKAAVELKREGLDLGSLDLGDL